MLFDEAFVDLSGSSYADRAGSFAAVSTWSSHLKNDLQGTDKWALTRSTSALLTAYGGTIPPALLVIVEVDPIPPVSYAAACRTTTLILVHRRWKRFRSSAGLLIWKRGVQKLWASSINFEPLRIKNF
jgi:hypothetical protein